MPALKDLFTRKLRLKRGEQGLRFVFEGTIPAAQPPAAQAPSSDMAANASGPMRNALTALLDRVKGSRRVVRHLAAIEHTLARKDPTGLFIFELPIERLQTALREFDTLSGGTAAGGLAALRGQLVAAIAAHQDRERMTRLQQPISSFLTDEKLQVSEVRHSDFDKASAAWLEPPPGGKPPPKA
ncbi:MAG: hypothetical protein ABI781_07370 [Burkholderiales bacterium]